MTLTKSQKIETLYTYLKMKVEERDFHAVSDAANDLRVLEASPARSNEEIHQGLLAGEKISIDEFKNLP